MSIEAGRNKTQVVLKADENAFNLSKHEIFICRRTMQPNHSNKTLAQSLKLIHKRNTYASRKDGEFEGFSFWKNY